MSQWVSSCNMHCNRLQLAVPLQDMDPSWDLLHPPVLSASLCLDLGCGTAGSGQMRCTLRAVLGSRAWAAGGKGTEDKASHCSGKASGKWPPRRSR